MGNATIIMICMIISLSLSLSLSYFSVFGVYSILSITVFLSECLSNRTFLEISVFGAIIYAKITWCLYLCLFSNKMNKPISNAWNTLLKFNVCLFNLSPTSILGDFEFRYIEFMCKKKLYPVRQLHLTWLLCVTVIVMVIKLFWKNEIRVHFNCEFCRKSAAR